jgi:hypothetical protein
MECGPLTGVATVTYFAINFAGLHSVVAKCRVLKNYKTIVTLHVRGEYLAYTA